MNTPHDGDYKMKKLFLLSIVLSVILRLPWIIIPIMMPDEALLLTVGGQIASGGAIYGLDFMDTRGPGGSYLAGLIAYVFGYGNTLAFHLLSIVALIIILFLIRRLGIILFNEATATLACLIFAVFSYAYILHNTVAFNVEFMGLPFLLGSAILFYQGLKQPEDASPIVATLVRFFFAGFFCAVTFAFKQVLAGFLGIYLLMLLRNWWNRDLSFSLLMRNISFILLGFVVGFILIFAPTLINIGWKETIYWLILFGGKYSVPNMLTKIFNFGARVILLFIAQPLLWTLTFLWIGESILKYNSFTDSEKQARIYILLMLIVQWVGAIVAGSGQGHHQYAGIVFMSIMTADIMGRFLEIIKDKLSNILYRTVVTSIIFIGFLPPVINYTLFPEGVQTGEYAITALFKEKLMQKNDPVSQAVKFIQEHTTKDDRIYNCGTLYDIYPLSRRLPATIALGLIRFEPKDQDSFLAKTYQRIVTDLRTQPPKIILVGCPLYRSINLETGPWEELRNILKEKYQPPIRLSWEGRLKFLSGKNKLMENIEEWLDVYVLKPVPSK
jgi:hypothetical protein